MPTCLNPNQLYDGGAGPEDPTYLTPFLNPAFLRALNRAYVT